MMILEFLKSIYRAFIAQFNSTSTINSPPINSPPINSTLNDNSATKGDSVPDGNSHLPSQESSTKLLLSYYKHLARRHPPIVPPSWYQAESSPVLGRVVFRFAQDIDELRNETPFDQIMGWTAQLDLFTRDVPSMLRNGLFLTPENVKEQENHVKHTHAEGIGFLHNRCYTVTSSTWSGNLNVCASTVRPVANFRLDNLKPDKVFTATVGNHNSDLVYYYDVRTPENNANYIYDDMPLDGLWPWPKKEEVTKDEEVSKREGEAGDQGGETEQQETKEGEEVVKGEGGGGEGEVTEWEEELDSFSGWGEEDPLIDSWRD